MTPFQCFGGIKTEDGSNLGENTGSVLSDNQQTTVQFFGITSVHRSARRAAFLDEFPFIEIL